MAIYQLPSPPLKEARLGLRARLAAFDALVQRPRSARNVVFLLTLWLVVAANWSLWLNIAHLGTTPLGYLPSVFGMLVLLFSATLALLTLTAWSRWCKPLWFGVVLTAAFAQHYMLSYSVVMDPSMIANVFQTDMREARDLLSWRMVFNVLIVAAPVGWWLSRIRVIAMPWWAHLWRNVVLLLVSLAVGVCGTMAMFKVLGPLMRNNAELRYMANPISSIYSTIRVVAGSAKTSQALVIVSGGAALGASYAAQAKPPLLLLVLGETARADHFSLNGYGRNTNPELAKQGVLSWTHSRSCGTSTAASVPCMFSPFGKTAFESRKADTENLLDVLQASGLAVLWIDNQSGCKGVCNRVPNVSTYEAKNTKAMPGLCNGDECLDEIMLQDIDERIAALPAERRNNGVVVVMHQMGSHGPAYNKRSSAATKHFKPECTNVTLSECSHEELINAFDNSIVYTDHMLGKSIAWLRDRSSVNQTAMLYVSDHGESLGENGIYLHGMPYVFAPVEQKHNAMIAWLNGGLAARTNVKSECVAKTVGAPVTHDNLYHTVLGMMDVTSVTYQPTLDIFDACRTEG